LTTKEKLKFKIFSREKIKKLYQQADDLRSRRTKEIRTSPLGKTWEMEVEIFPRRRLPEKKPTNLRTAAEQGGPCKRKGNIFHRFLGKKKIIFPREGPQHFGGKERERQRIEKP